MADQSTGALVKQALEEFSDLARKEFELAVAEMAAKGRQASRGGALFGAAAVLAFVGFEALVAAGVVALSSWLELWAAALVTGGALFVAAGLCAMAARRHAKKAAPMKPEKTIKGVKADVEAIRERAGNHDKRPEHSGRAATPGAEGTLPTG
ncbi:phage holin family protein [Streptomyces sp. 184]|uniref:phage holin family protein n=1 Tax=Streptomyces sp. 184 TaxID=1827526 RepID=UPI0038923932